MEWWPTPPPSQIWKRQKKTRTWKLEPCFLGSCGGGVAAAAAALLTSVPVARIRRDQPHTLVCTTSADIPLETTAFHISKHYKLVAFTATSSSSSHSSWAFWFGFQSSRSSIHPHEELAKFSKGVDFGEFYLLTRWVKDLSPCCFWERERERENEGFGACVFFLKHTNLLKDRAKGREEWRIFSKTTCDSRVHKS